ncbi:MAG: hypothetical protein HY909_24420 [Deltaproteobacteria bacterium]|nr:hypothetical protein [Deltaproteobacteria bacterium]
MSTQGRPSIGKRQRELKRQERQREKVVKREQRALDKKNRPEAPPGVDPDIAGVIPGPQPPAED